MSKYPDFMIIGAARSGTSSMHKNLEQHPNIAGPSKLKGNQKEAHFFDKVTKFNRGPDWYLNLWPDVDGVLKFESTPNYLYVREVPGRIRHNLLNWKDLKFIVMLRDPVFRAWSHYWHWREKHQQPPDILMDTESIFIKKGIYIDQLLNWFKYFDKKQFMIIQSEAYFFDERKSLKGVFEFLGVRDIDLQKIIYFDPKTENKRPIKYNQMPVYIKEFMRYFYKAHNEKLFKFLDQRFEDWI